jgi:hypothetical protein
MNLKGISWTAWCYDINWEPRIVDSNWNLLDDNYSSGELIKSELE